MKEHNIMKATISARIGYWQQSGTLKTWEKRHTLHPARWRFLQNLATWVAG